MVSIVLFIFTPIWGKIPLLTKYFSNGLKPPTRWSISGITEGCLVGKIILHVDFQAFFSAFELDHWGFHPWHIPWSLTRSVGTEPFSINWNPICWEKGKGFHADTDILDGSTIGQVIWWWRVRCFAFIYIDRSNNISVIIPFRTKKGVGFSSNPSTSKTTTNIVSLQP